MKAVPVRAPFIVGAAAVVVAALVGGGVKSVTPRPENSTAAQIQLVGMADDLFPRSGQVVAEANMIGGPQMAACIQLEGLRVHEPVEVRLVAGDAATDPIAKTGRIRPRLAIGDRWSGSPYVGHTF
ncbi:hypothetical protein [Rhodococcus sp. NPDC049939]|uniref:hypothetical protein n=1 Tax=Rhodococcus sp. NPDC049939 TaxID=3155511 RepID=UPI0033D25B79